MRTAILNAFYLTAGIILLNTFTLSAQDKTPLKYSNPYLYCGIEVGSKGVKMSLLEIKSVLTEVSFITLNVPLFFALSPISSKLIFTPFEPTSMPQYK